MRIYQTQLTEVSTLVDVKCDVCRKSCLDSQFVNYEYATLHASWGYHTNKDGITWDCEICSDCADKIHQFIESLGGIVRISYD